MRVKTIGAVVVTAGALSLLGGLVGAQKAKKASFDATFVQKASQGGIAEVDAGQLASEQASAENVKDFGQQMVKDHSDANQALRELADKNHITAPTETDAAHKAALEKLKTLHGAAFDATYVKAQRADHLAAIKLFETEAKQGTNAELKAFASKTLPTIRSHYNMLQNINKKPVSHSKT